VRQIDANGNVTQIAYDAAGDVTSASTPDGNGSQLATMTYGYDGDGERTSSTPGRESARRERRQLHHGHRLQRRRPAGVGHPGGGAGATVTPRTAATSTTRTATRPRSRPRGYATTSTYDAADGEGHGHRPARERRPDLYDGLGDVAQTVPPAGSRPTTSRPPRADVIPAGYGQRLAADATSYTFNSMARKRADLAHAGRAERNTDHTTLQR